MNVIMKSSRMITPVGFQLQRVTKGEVVECSEGQGHYLVAYGYAEYQDDEMREEWNKAKARVLWTMD